MIEIIAEIGAHHNCSIVRAFKLIELAKEAGADAVKFQIYKADNLVTQNAKTYWNESRTQHEVFKERDSFGIEEWETIATYCDDVGIEFLATPFDLEAVDMLERFGVKRYKIASGDITFKPLLQAVRKTGKPVLLSTGASTFKEVSHALTALRGFEPRTDITLMHCVLCYPSNQGNIGRLRAMATIFNSCKMGLSNHVIEDNMETVIAAVGAGASTIEVHFTDDRTLPGDDHAHSFTPDMIRKLKDITQKLDDDPKEYLDCELPAREGARRSIVSIRHIQAGIQIKEEDLICKRPGTGISPMEMDSIIGKTAKRDIDPDIPISWEDVR